MDLHGTERCGRSPGLSGLLSKEVIEGPKIYMVGENRPCVLVLPIKVVTFDPRSVIGAILANNRGKDLLNS